MYGYILHSWKFCAEEMFVILQVDKKSQNYTNQSLYCAFVSNIYIFLFNNIYGVLIFETLFIINI